MMEHRTNSTNTLLKFLIFIAIFLAHDFSLFLTPNVSAQTTILTEDNLRDAIIGKKLFSQEQLGEMDLNQDGDLDVADLVMLLKSSGIFAPVASFELATSSAMEHDGFAMIRITFSSLYTGILNFIITGTAQTGFDYQIADGSISVNGLSVNIPIFILDDIELEDEETIIISLEPDQSDPPQLILGVPQEHTLRLLENDAVWRGRLQVDNLSMPFEMAIFRRNSLYQAFLQSDGQGGIPAGEYQVDLQVTNNSFSASIDKIQIDEQSTMIGTAFQRTIFLEATPERDDSHEFDANSIIRGKMTDSIEPTVPLQTHLSRVIEGGFILVKEPSRVPLYELELN